MIAPSHISLFWYLLKSVSKGQSVLRALMNRSLSDEIIRRKVVDVGGGRHPDYFSFLKKEGDVSIEALDASISKIDFEKDVLPYPTASVDTVICCNVLEHIYHYIFLTGEMHRVLKPGGSLIGFVPFLINYHPDPHDYFRYTKESLVRIFGEAGFSKVAVREVGAGPILLNFNNIVLSLPIFLRPLLLPFYYWADVIVLALRPGLRTRYPMGYIFVAHA
ncbi:MAG: methyltransferase domain-containing protein [Patescibacteria group bacterium]